MKQTTLALVLSLLVFSGCASRSVVDSLMELPERSPESAVLVDFMIDSDKAMPRDFGCNLVFAKNNGEEWAIKLDFLQTRVFAFAPPGKIRIKEVNCQEWGVYPVRSGDQPLNGEIFEGRLNYFGFVSFKYSGGSLNWEFIKDRSTRDRLRRSTESLSNYWKDQLVAVQAGRPIYSALRKYDELPRRMVKWVTRKRGGRSDFNLPKFERCDRLDAFNPVVVGELGLTVEYSEGRYINHTWRKREHTHAAGYEECVLDLLKGFQLESSDQVTLEVSL